MQMPHKLVWSRQQYVSLWLALGTYADICTVLATRPPQPPIACPTVLPPTLRLAFPSPR